MAHILLRNLPSVAKPKWTPSRKNFEYLLVLDFEATCTDIGKMEPQEIIEFPCVALSTKDWQVKDVFHKYVKPKVNPELTPFCVRLTGILQEMVDNEPHFPQVFSDFCHWLKNGRYFEEKEKSAFVTCGDWDFKVMLPEQCAVDGITLPAEFKQWINLKNTFSNSTFYYPRNLVEMLGRLELRSVGRLHSGIDDVNNMVRIIQTLQERYKPRFKITSKYEETKENENGIQK